VHVDDYSGQPRSVRLANRALKQLSRKEKENADASLIFDAFIRTCANWLRACERDMSLISAFCRFCRTKTCCTLFGCAGAGWWRGGARTCCLIPVPSRRRYLFFLTGRHAASLESSSISIITALQWASAAAARDTARILVQTERERKREGERERDREREREREWSQPAHPHVNARSGNFGDVWRT